MEASFKEFWRFLVQGLKLIRFSFSEGRFLKKIAEMPQNTLDFLQNIGTKGCLSHFFK